MTDIDALVALGEGITPGEWFVIPHTGEHWSIQNRSHGVGACIAQDYQGSDETNARAIAAVPRMIAALTALSDEIAVLKRQRDAALDAVTAGPLTLAAHRCKAEELEAEIAVLKEREGVLSDPNAVHVNMLRGGIARPSVAQIWHVYQRDLLDGMPEDYRAALTDKAGS